MHANQLPAAQLSRPHDVHAGGCATSPSSAPPNLSLVGLVPRNALPPP